MKGKEINYITPAGLKVLVDELNQLVKVERPDIVKVVSWAASLGDRSENADYIYGKKRMREIDRRIRFLTKRIDLSEAVDSLIIESEKVQFGATVTVISGNDEKKTFSIVGVDETNAKRGHISWKSPIGRTLLRKEEGDDVIVRTPNGDVEYEIISIEYKTIEREDL
jgi:transcription elongation factor GreB